MKTRNGIILLFLILLFLLSTYAQISPPFEGLKAVTEEEARQFINECAAQFAKLDLDAHMALFSKEAVENRMLPYADIREAYRRTIARSKSIQYQVKIYSIQPSPRGVLVTGRYEIVQVFKSMDEKEVFKGNIQWELVRENGSLKIKAINYGRDQ